jgi:hypothetical protein
MCKSLGLIPSTVEEEREEKEEAEEEGKRNKGELVTIRGC